MTSVPVVTVKKLNRSFIDMRLDEKLMMNSKKIFAKITANHLSYLVRLQNDEINRDFPEDLPEKLEWPGKSLFPRTEKKAPPIKPEFLGIVEAEEFTGGIFRQRQKRPCYNGTYNVESLASISMVATEEVKPSNRKRLISESSAASTVSKASCSRSSVAPLKLKISVPQSSRKLSSSSSSSDSSLSSSSDSFDEKTLRKRKTPAQRTPTVPKLMKASRQLALNNPKVANVNPKPVSTEDPDKPVVLREEPKKQADGVEDVAPGPKPVAQITSQVSKKPHVIIKPRKFEPPKIVEAPQMDPKTNKPITKEALNKQRLKKIPRIPKKVNTLQALGGIFTVDNGWEKTEESAKAVDQPKSTSPVFNVQEDIRTPPLPIISPELAEFNIPRKPRSPVRAPTAFSFVKACEIEMLESGTDKFNRHRDSDESSSDEEMPELLTKAVSSSSSSSESEDEGKQADATTVQEPEPKETQSEHSSNSSSDEERKVDSDRESSPKLIDSTDFEDVVLLDDDIELDYEDDDERDLSYEPPKSLAAKSEPKVVPKTMPVIPEENYTAELDELKLTLRKEELVPITAPKEDAKSEFDRNTDEIMSKIAPPVDTATLRVLQQFFGNICIDFLEDNCPFQASACKHYLPDAQAVAQRLERCALQPVDSAFNLALQFPNKLLFPYFSQFAEQFTKKAFMPLKDESRLARMIMECEKNARSHIMYRTVAGALVSIAQIPPYKATKFIINYHTDSPYAREIIMQMIIETGPDLIRNIDYLQRIAASQTVSTSIIDKILTNCVTYQDPAMPKLCLELLMTLEKKQIGELKPESVTNFIHLQTELSNNNDDREMKAAHFALQVSQVPKKRPPPNV